MSQVGSLSRQPDDVRPDTEATSRVTYSAPNVDSAAAVVAQLVSDGVVLDDLDITSPTLDDVFAHLTMQGLRQ
jgi:ABC-2 type transport system ATP-binding protein